MDLIDKKQKKMKEGHQDRQQPRSTCPVRKD